MTIVQEHLISDFASSLRMHYNLKGQFGIEDFIEKKLRGRILEKAFEDSSIRSEIRIENNSITFYICKNEKEKQIILAKCVGHLIFHLGFFGKKPKKTVYIDSPLYQDCFFEKDGVALCFALEFLMPEKCFLESFYKEKNISTLAKHFKVAESAIRERCTWLGLAGGYI